MDWEAITPEEAKTLKYASTSGKESPYVKLLEAVENGPIKVNVPADSNLQSLKWALSRQIKKSGKKITISTLADKSGVVLRKEAADPPKK